LTRFTRPSVANRPSRAMRRPPAHEHRPAGYPVSCTLAGRTRYKERWQIELFFKWVKQHLNIKRFLGRSENAVRIQILTALIAYLLLALYKRANGLPNSLWSVLGEIRATLFTRPALEAQRYRRRCEEQAELAKIQLGLFA